jgi:hypothetical protein
MANAMVSTVSPNARDTPNNPIPTAGNAAANTALPQPPNTNQNVPNPSVIERLNKDMQPVLDRSLYRICKSVMLPADLLQRPSGHCTDYSTVAAQIQSMKKRQGPMSSQAWR